MDTSEFFAFSIYTIVDLSKLVVGEPFTETEKKRWVTGRQLLDKAKKVQCGVPLLLGDAADCSRLMYWGILEKVGLPEEGGTTFTVDRVRQFAKPHKPQELVLRSTNKNIAPNFIRPYAICKTPDFLGDE